MPPAVRSRGEEEKVETKKLRSGLNPLRGPSAILVALAQMLRHSPNG
jgi:hypothetical protein